MYTCVFFVIVAVKTGCIHVCFLLLLCKLDVYMCVQQQVEPRINLIFIAVANLNFVFVLLHRKIYTYVA